MILSSADSQAHLLPDHHQLIDLVLQQDAALLVQRLTQSNKRKMPRPCERKTRRPRKIGREANPKKARRASPRTRR